MTAMLRIALRVIQRRVEAGEALDAVLQDYPRMTEAERNEVKMALEAG